ncbi:MAG: PRC-barrel domain-containing protein [Selenomonadaceae bacterium]|nr:PRC-barrel domain-containing protein [Selenomonadaceae bacterium]
MKKSVEILGLPIISITEGRELGTSKSLLIDAKNGVIAALTIEDDDWYRGVKLIPYESIIAIGEDAITITHSDNILNLEEAGDYERLLVENIRVIGTKAITKSGRIQGKVTEVFIGEGGRIEQCEITTPDGSTNEVTAEQISIFGKQVTVINVDAEKKNSLNEAPAFEPAFEAFSTEQQPEISAPLIVETEPVEIPQAEEKIVEPVEVPQAEEKSVEPVEVPQAEEKIVEPVEVPQAEEKIVEPVEVPQVEEKIVEPVEVPQVEEKIVEPVEVPHVEAPKKLSDEEQKIASMTQQAEDLKAALQKARASQKQSAPAPEPAPQLSQKMQVEKAVDERRRRVLLGKHATKTITAEGGTLVVEAGGEVTEDVLQRARLANKFIELSMNVQ